VRADDAMEARLKEEEVDRVEVKEAAFIEAPPLTEEVISEVLVHFKYHLIN
jgi:hypothetical protein